MSTWSGSWAYYHPFGDYHGTASTKALTDIGFTGHKSNSYHNNETGEINLGPDLFSKGNIYNHIFGAIHEIGHAIDSNVGYTLAQAMLENAGAEHSYFLGWDLGINKDGFCFRSHACNEYNETWAKVNPIVKTTKCEK